MRRHIIDVSRGLAAAAVLLSAVVHLDLYESGFRDLATIGPLFLLNAIGGLIIGVAVVVWRHWFIALVAAGFGATTVFFYWVSVIHGLFGFKEINSGWAQVTAQWAEYGAVGFGLTAAVLLWLERKHRDPASDDARGAVRRPPRGRHPAPLLHRPH